jgi:Transglycosylase SLT domain
MSVAAVGARAVLENPRARKWLVRGGLASVAAILLPLLVVVAVMSSLFGSDQTGSIGTAGGIPAVYAPIYAAAAAHFDVNPYVLAALHQTESDFSRNPAAFQPNSAGAIGPMQFLPSTWAGYSSAFHPISSDRPSNYPHVCTPHPCITDDFDSIAAAAEYLHRLGADAQLGPHTLDALIRYKGSPPASVPYAREALSIARRLEEANGTPAPRTGPLAARLVSVANRIAAAQIPYCYGGGHTTPAAPGHGTYCVGADNAFISGTAYLGLDCSSSVSMLLQLAGVDTPTLDSSGFMRFGLPGPGRAFTVWANPTHVFVTLDGQDWGTSDANPHGGPGWAVHATVGFTPRHLSGV